MVKFKVYYVEGDTKKEQEYESNKSIAEVFDEFAVKARTPLGREQTPEDIGKTVAFFASEESSEITGQALNVNGGATLN